MRKLLFITLALMLLAIAIAYFRYSQKTAEEEIGTRKDAHEPTPNLPFTGEVATPAPPPMKIDRSEESSLAYERDSVLPSRTGVIRAVFFYQGGRIKTRVILGHKTVAKVISCAQRRPCKTLVSGERPKATPVKLLWAGITKDQGKTLAGISFERMVRQPRLGLVPEECTVYLEPGKFGFVSGYACQLNSGVPCERKDATILSSGSRRGKK